jgi:hypothetical protein
MQATRGSIFLGFRLDEAMETEIQHPLYSTCLNLPKQRRTKQNNDRPSPSPCVLPGILALPGYDLGSVKYLLRETVLPGPEFFVSPLEGRLTTAKLID